MDAVEVGDKAIRIIGSKDILQAAIIGEAKSFGKGELITSSELAKLKTVASKLSEAVIAIAILRDDFTKADKEPLKRFVS